MKASDVALADDWLREIKRIDKALAADRPSAKVSVVTRSDLGQDFTTDVALPAPHWRDALAAFRADLARRLEALGVEVDA